jgi:hypothetical protein
MFLLVRTLHGPSVMTANVLENTSSGATQAALRAFRANVLEQTTGPLEVEQHHSEIAEEKKANRTVYDTNPSWWRIVFAPVG